MATSSSALAEARLAAALRDHESGRLQQAKCGYLNILEDDPNHTDALHLLGLIMVGEGAPYEGAGLIERAIELSPGCAPHHNSLATAYRMMGQTEAALSEYQTACALRPDSAEIHNNLATTLRDLERNEEAVTHYRMAAKLRPDMAQVWYNLANCLADCGYPAEAEGSYRQALALDSHYVDALGNFGRWLMLRGRWLDAKTQLERAVQLAPSSSSIWHNLGITLAELRQPMDAESCYRHAVQQDPRNTDARLALGWLLFNDGRTDEAISTHQQAVALDPANETANLAWCMAHLPLSYACDADMEHRRRSYIAALTKLVGSDRRWESRQSSEDAVGSAQPFFLPYQGEDDRPLQISYGRWAVKAVSVGTPPIRQSKRRARAKRIRLGLVSGFFCDHTIYKLFLEGWLAELDRDRFEIIGFHTGREEDARTVRAEGQCDVFAKGLASPHAWARAIADHSPDVLLYPEVGMDPVAGYLAAMRLAPLQCVTWGHPNTTGLSTIDWFLSSELMEPFDGDEFYSERLVRLPNLSTCYLPDPVSEIAPDGSSPQLRTDVPIFWSGQVAFKYNPRLDCIFPRIAQIVGPCQFAFIAYAKSPRVTQAFRERLQAAFSAFGLDAEEYCVFLPPMTQDAFLASIAAADVVLDTIGWSGGRSTLDGLATNPVIVTWPGRFMRARHTAAILQRAGCPDTIVHSLDDYVMLAATLAISINRRLAVRTTVARGKARVYRDVEYIRALETVLATGRLHGV
jgi:predicted O-linked N-acetylglucosamine transferase (SPINDLY family)